MEDIVLKKLQEKTLETLKFTLDFFEQHNIRYFAYGGTCLGAVRHHNIIPWDDDVDLVLPYEDYQRLLSMKDEVNSTGKFRLYTPDDTGYYDPMSRITNTDSTIWRYYLNNIVFGAQIDIFPLYRTDIEDVKEMIANQKELFKKCYRFQRANQHYSLVRFKENIQNKHLRGLKKNLKWAWSTRHVEQYRKEYFEKERTLHVPDGMRYVSYTSYIYGIETYPLEWFADYEEVPFADITIRIPKGWDEYLRYVYHDYMQLPPEERRHPAHGSYYINLKEGLTLDEVRKRIRKGERCVY